MRLVFRIAILFSSVIAGSVIAGTRACDLYKDLPKVMQGCEGEACGILRYNKAIKDASIYQKPDKNSKKVGVLKRCQEIKGFETFFKLKKLGVAKVKKTVNGKNVPKLAVSDILPVVKGHGEGYLLACVGKQEFDVALSSAGGPVVPEVEDVVWPETEAWVRLRLPNGVLGYAEDNDFYMGYYGYEPSLFCPGDKPE